jgi:NTP pyrophosphatase (non-canonical NTP hydrolase)
MASENRDRRQAEVARWAAECFGREQATSLPQRGIRLLEEAVELAQAAGCERAMALALVDYVFSRPVGELGREIGGVSTTLLALAEAAGTSADEEEAREVARVLAAPREHFAARNAAKNAAGFLAAGGDNISRDARDGEARDLTFCANAVESVAGELESQAREIDRVPHLYAREAAAALKIQAGLLRALVPSIREVNAEIEDFFARWGRSIASSGA